MSMKIEIDAGNLHYRNLNRNVKEYISKGVNNFKLKNVYGQRYIGAGVKGKVKINIYGVAGNDLGVFMDGAEIYVYGNCQDGAGNTMNAGKIVVYGSAGDIIGHSMRGGEIFIKEDVGYRTGIHMKAFENNFPVITIGGVAKDYLGEYMAGGLIILLNLKKEKVRSKYIGTGMHGGEIFIRGEINDYQMGKEPAKQEVKKDEIEKIIPYIKEFCGYFGFDIKDILSEKFYKLIPVSHRPYGKLYAY